MYLFNEFFLSSEATVHCKTTGEDWGPQDGWSAEPFLFGEGISSLLDWSFVASRVAHVSVTVSGR